jgi:rfaE bifunctional protein nucleotidyltransferase chain/domain
LTALEKITDKIVNWDDAQLKVADWKSQNDTLVFTNGCFDLMHIGHLDYLSKAKDLGSRLIIGLNSSASVSRLKGPSRPINSNDSRGKMLAALEFVDLVVLFSEDTPLELINHLQPNILVKGGDYTKENIIGAKEVENLGGTVEIIKFVDGFSTTSLVTKIQNLSKI